MLEYTGLRVRDLARSRRFYTEGLGLAAGRSVRRTTGGTSEALRDPSSGAVLELNHYPDAPSYHVGDELDHLAFRVDDLAGCLARLEALGGRVRIRPTEEDGAIWAFVTDPDGVWIKLVEGRSPDLPPTSRPME